MKPPLIHEMKASLPGLLRRCIRLGLLVCLLAAAVSPSAAQVAQPLSPVPFWVRECVTCSQPQVYGASASLALDPQGYPRVAYRGDSVIRFAYQDAAGWHFETVDASYATDEIFLQTGPDGREHILYTDGGDIRYAVRDAGGWQVEIIFDHFDFNDGNSSNLDLKSLVLDSQGNPRGSVAIIYARGSRTLVYYIYLGETGWQVETVGEGFDAALALGPGDTPHVIHSYIVVDEYDHQIDSFLVHSWQDEQGWHSEEIARPSPGFNLAIAVDCAGWPHIVAQGNYYIKTPAGWAHTLIYSVSDPILLLTGEHIPRIGSHDGHHVIYTTWTPDGWVVIHLPYEIGYNPKQATASNASDISLSPWGINFGMAIDAAGDPHFAYRQGDIDVIYMHPYTGTLETVLYLPLISE